MKIKDEACLAEGLIEPADFTLTGRNLNQIVVGPTASGKTLSISESRLLHTKDSSVVVPIAKKAIRDKFVKCFEQKGYEVIELNFVQPSKCSTGYDPLDFVRNDQDIMQLANNLYGVGTSKNMLGESDPYWGDSTKSVIAALIAAVMITAEDKKVKPRFSEVIKLYRKLKVVKTGKIICTSLDDMFELMERHHPGNLASALWDTVKGLSVVTASCIFSMVNTAFDKVFAGNVMEIFQKDTNISFKDLGSKKTAVFITTSPMNKTLHNFVNMMYSDMFKELFLAAESNVNGHLDIPVHILCDDFACGSKIPDFEEYISIFRAAGISTTILLQSESQLINMYGESAATTIINNCDTYIYMGGMDLITCKHISERLDKPLKSIMSMPLESTVVFRRGVDPFIGRRYQTLDDPLYKEILESVEPFEANCRA